MSHSTVRRCAFPALLALLLGFAAGSTAAGEPTPTSSAPAHPEPSETEAPPLHTWWGHLRALCGKAYAGSVTSEDPTDAALAEQPMTMHVRRCEERRLEIPFHVGENRSRTWVLTRKEQGLHLQHDHRHEDGSHDTVTLYGGHTKTPGSTIAQHFPADDHSKKLFEANGLSASVVNVWSMEIVPGERFSYILRRPGRYFRADFDLTQAIEPPPAPWGHE